MSNSLDPYQDQHPVIPDLGSTCLQMLSADAKVAASKDIVKERICDMFGYGIFKLSEKQEFQYLFPSPNVWNN